MAEKVNEDFKAAEKSTELLEDYDKSFDVSDDKNNEKETSKIKKEETVVDIDPNAIDREKILLAHRELLMERVQLQIKNNLLHRRLAEYYKRRHQAHALRSVEVTPDMEETYEANLFAYADLLNDLELQKTKFQEKVDAVQAKYEQKVDNAKKIFNDLQNLERSTGTGLIYSHKGKPLSDKTVTRLLNLQRQKLEQAAIMRMHFIRLRNIVREKESIKADLDKVGPDLYVAEYEVLKIENYSYSSKIEERVEELINHRTKCSTLNMMLAHIREKLHHNSAVIETAVCDLGEAEIKYQKARYGLSDIKANRDKIRCELNREVKKAGLLTRKDLLHDYQDSIALLTQLKTKKENLERAIAEATVNLRERRCFEPSLYGDSKHSMNSI